MEHRRAAARTRRIDFQRQDPQRRARRRMRIRRVVVGAGRRGPHGRRHRSHADRHRGRHQGRRRARFDQRDVRPGRHHVVRRLRRTVQHRCRQHLVPFVADRRTRRVPAGGTPGGRTGSGLLHPGVRQRRVPAETEFGPNTVSEDELRQAVSKYWTIDEIRPAFIHANMGAAIPADAPFTMPTFDIDEKGRQKMPAFLLTATKSD